VYAALDIDGFSTVDRNTSNLRATGRIITIVNIQLI